MSPRPTVTKDTLVNRSEEILSAICVLERQASQLVCDVADAINVTMDAISAGNDPESQSIDVDTHHSNCMNYKILKSMAESLRVGELAISHAHQRLDVAAKAILSLVA